MIRSEEVQLPQGTIRYRELGQGEPIVFVHGFLVDGRLWTATAEALSATHRCILPDWPMGAHRVAMNADADLSPPGIANLIADFLEALDLSGATIVGNDSGGAMSQVLATRRPERIGRLVLTNCDTHDNFPPSVFKAMPPLAKLPRRDDRDGAAVPDRCPAQGRLCALCEDQDPSRADRQLDGARATRRRREAGHGEVHRRHEQALHARGR